MRKSLYILIIVLFAGCIENYTHKGVEEIDDLLVIEGIITEGESVFSLRRSIGLTWEFSKEKYIDDAIVYVEKDNGELLYGTNNGNGEYIVHTGTLDPNTKYRLSVKIGEDEYESEFLSPFFTPEIDSIMPVKRRAGEPVYICLNTHDINDQSRYYLWSFKDIWEVKTELMTERGDTYYCWGRDYSRKIIVGSSEYFSENMIYQKRINEIPCDNDRISILYYITVEQNQIRKEAHDYFANVQKNIEQTGSIFSPVPSEMKGNIRCITNPDIPVIGYIEVSTTVNKSVFISDEEWGFYEAPVKGCYQEILDYQASGYQYYGGGMFAPAICVDCTYKEKATKNRPDFWPTEHY